MLDLGKAIDETTIKNGLQELNKDTHFDLGACIDQRHPFIEVRQGVYYKGRHVCSMDRHMVPEYKVWQVVERRTPVSLGDADKEGALVRYEIVPETAEGYHDLYDLAAHGKTDEYQVRSDGKLMRIWAEKIGKARGRCVSVGWRHTFEKLLWQKIPGITRESLGAKFGVDMYKFPVGPPEELVDALTEE